MAITTKFAVNVSKDKWSYLAFEGPPGWFNSGGTTEVTSVTGSNCDWGAKKKVTVIDNTTLVVSLKSKGLTRQDDPTDGTVTVVLTNVTDPPPPTTVQYTNDPNPML
jgi:hypothetical protein